jgi:hypothetical protein
MMLEATALCIECHTISIRRKIETINIISMHHIAVNQCILRRTAAGPFPVIRLDEKGRRPHDAPIFVEPQADNSPGGPQP